MTVKELIEQLQKMPQESEVIAESPEWPYFTDIEQVTFETDPYKRRWDEIELPPNDPRRANSPKNQVVLS